MKLTNHTFACNSLTNFEYKTQTRKKYVNLLKIDWKNSWNQIKWTYFVAGFSYLESLCTSAVSFLSALNGLTSPSKQDGHSPLIMTVERSENSRGGGGSNVVGIICPLVKIGLTELVNWSIQIWGFHGTLRLLQACLSCVWARSPSLTIDILNCINKL